MAEVGGPVRGRGWIGDGRARGGVTQGADMARESVAASKQTFPVPEPDRFLAAQRCEVRPVAAGWVSIRTFFTTESARRAGLIGGFAADTEA
jgi:hypothetical protein